jgi:hypothetical protein
MSASELPGLLDRLEAAVRVAGAPIASHWAPGATDEQLDELFVPLGIALPDEARCWFRWHDGTRPGAPVTEVYLGHGIPLSADLIAEFFAEDIEDERATIVNNGLLQMFPGKPIIFFRVDGPPDQEVPVYWQDDIEDPTERWPSIAAFVATILELIETKAWLPPTCDQGSWHPAPGRLYGLYDAL